MHTPIPQNSRLANGDAAVHAALASSRAENPRNGGTAEFRRKSKRKPSVTDATLAPRQKRKAPRERAARTWVDDMTALLERNQIRMPAHRSRNAPAPAPN